MSKNIQGFNNCFVKCEYSEKSTGNNTEEVHGCVMTAGWDTKCNSKALRNVLSAAHFCACNRWKQKLLTVSNPVYIPSSLSSPELHTFLRPCVHSDSKAEAARVEVCDNLSGSEWSILHVGDYYRWQNLCYDWSREQTALSAVEEPAVFKTEEGMSTQNQERDSGSLWHWSAVVHHEFVCKD